MLNQLSLAVKVLRSHLQNTQGGEKEQTLGAKKHQALTRTKLAGNQPSLSRILPHHHSLLVASITSMTSPALNPSSWSSIVTWSQRASAYTTLPSLMSCGQSKLNCQLPPGKQHSQLVRLQLWHHCCWAKQVLITVCSPHAVWKGGGASLAVASTDLPLSSVYSESLGHSMFTTIKNRNSMLWNFLLVTLPQPANKAQGYTVGGGCSCAASAALPSKALK